MFQFRRQGPPVQLRGGEVVFLRDVLGPQEAQPVELYLQGAAVLVGVPLDLHVGLSGSFVEELFGEFSPHAGVDRAGTVDQLQREVGHAAAVLADRGFGGKEAGAQPGAGLQIARPELLFVQGFPRSYPFTAPAVSPETMRRWKIRTSITSGTVTTTAAAAWAP